MTRFADINLTYPPEYPGHDYEPSDLRQTMVYMDAIVGPSESLRAMLAPNFLHIDGAVHITDDGTASAANVTVVEGRDAFVDDFRNTVNQLSSPVGEAVGVLIAPSAFDQLLQQVKEQLTPEQAAGLGRLVTVCAGIFPYVLNPETHLPTEVPPPLQHLATKEESALSFAATGETGDRGRDYHEVHVIHALFANEQDQITARIGLVWGDPRHVVFAVLHQIKALRETGELPPAPSAYTVSQLLHQHAAEAQ